jgi:hypothetical protein
MRAIGFGGQAQRTRNCRFSKNRAVTPAMLATEGSSPSSPMRCPRDEGRSRSASRKSAISLRTSGCRTRVAWSAISRPLDSGSRAVYLTLGVITDGQTGLQPVKWGRGLSMRIPGSVQYLPSLPFPALAGPGTLTAHFGSDSHCPRKGRPCSELR